MEIDEDYGDVKGNQRLKEKLKEKDEQINKLKAYMVRFEQRGGRIGTQRPEITEHLNYFFSCSKSS